MTTPENFRRRQRIEGAGLILLAIATIILGFYFHAQDIKQRDCLRDQVQEQANVFQARAKYSSQESQATRQIITDALSSKTEAQLLTAKHKYLHELKVIDRGRANNPIPDPTGECQ